MDEQEQKKLSDLLQRSVAPINRELSHDLWPNMLRRMDEGQRRHAELLSKARLASVPWFDWALLAALIVTVCVFPRSIPIWLYHF